MDMMANAGLFGSYISPWVFYDISLDVFSELAVSTSISGEIKFLF
jgi:hypothetical protein